MEKSALIKKKKNSAIFKNSIFQGTSACNGERQGNGINDRFSLCVWCSMSQAGPAAKKVLSLKLAWDGPHCVSPGSLPGPVHWEAAAVTVPMMQFLLWL